jgi:hypothetical protein
MQGMYWGLEMALKTKGNVSINVDVILKWIRDFNPGLNTEYWRVLGRLPKGKNQRLLLTYRASF